MEQNNVQIASETAFQYTCSIAEQREEKHSFYNKEEDTDVFNEKYQDIYDEMYNIVLNHLENVGI